MASLAALFHRRRQDDFHIQRDINGLDRIGSWLACIFAAIAACALIFSACAMNATHAWAVGIAEGPFRAAVLATASIGAAMLAPLGFLAVARGKGFGTRFAAFLLAVGCLAYTSASSLGFIATAKDANVSGRSAAIEAHQDQRALIADARRELSGLKGQRPEVMERRAELIDLLAKLTAPGTAPAKTPDAQAAALAFYIRAAGWQVDDAAVSTWLSLAMVLILEVGAALSLTVAAALRPERVGRPYSAVPAFPAPCGPEPAERPVRASGASAGASLDKDGDDDDQPKPPKPRGKGGRPVAILPEAAVAKLRKANGKGASIRGIAKILGTSKSTAHRVLHQLADLGMIRLRSTPAGCNVVLA